MKVKRENILKKMSRLISLLVIFIAAGWLCFIPTEANATQSDPAVVITESMGGYNVLNFTLTTIDPLGITEFIVGNNNASQFGHTIESANTILAQWQGYRIERESVYDPLTTYTDDNIATIQWRVLDQDPGYNSSWIDSYNPLFQDYTKAFLWTAFNVYDTGLLVGSPLEVGTYSTFIGYIDAGYIESPFLVHNTVGGAYDGETTNSIPEPLTVLLLGLGLTGLAGMRRKLRP